MLSVVLFPKSATQHFEQGVQLLNNQKHQKAITCFDKAIALSQHTAVFWERRGTAYLSLQNYIQAINDYSVAIQLSPQIGFYYTERALAFFAMGNQQSMMNDMIIAARLGEPDAIKIVSGWIASQNAQNAIQAAHAAADLQKNIDNTLSGIEERFGMKKGTMKRYA